VTELEQKIVENNLVVLRLKSNDKALNVSFTEEGLIYTLDNKGKYIFFKNAWVVPKNGSLIFKGDTRLNNRVYVEKFVPKNFETCKQGLNEDNELVDICTTTWPLQKAEYTFMNKALHLITYNALENQRSTQTLVVDN